MKTKPAIEWQSISGRKGTTYPQPFAEPVLHRYKRRVGEHFGLTQFGVNAVDLEPGAWSAQRHWHTREDELVYVIAGEIMLVTDEGEQMLTAGMTAGFPAGVGVGHHLVNRSDVIASYIEIGSRSSEDRVFYPDIDLELHPDDTGVKTFRRRDGSDYG